MSTPSPTNDDWQTPELLGPLPSQIYTLTFAGYSTTQTAAILGTTPAHVKTVIHTLRKDLRALLEDEAA